MVNSELLKIAEEYGTPTFVFDVKQLTARIKKMRQIIGKNIELCFSIKANPFLIEDIVPYVEHLEVCSPGELQICKARSMPASKIIYSGVNKGLEDIAEAIAYQSGIYTAESKTQFAYLDQIAREKNGVIDVLLRLSSGSQFGMSKEDLLWLIENRDKYPATHITGIHYFVGTQRKKTIDREEELKMLLDFFHEVEDNFGYKLEHLEYGPGLPFPYFENDDFLDTLRPLAEVMPTLEKVAKEVKLTIEMGRFIASECGYYLTRIADCKKTGGANYAIADGGMNHLNYLGQMMGMRNPVILQLINKEKHGAETPSDAPTDWTLCGSLCTTQDIIVRSKRFEHLAIGDVLAFCNVGAYTVTEGIYLFLSRRMPKVVLAYETGHTKLIREGIESFQVNTLFLG